MTCDCMGPAGRDAVAVLAGRARSAAETVFRRVSMTRYSPSGPQAGEPDDHALGRSRGGLTTKVHLAADAGLAFVFAPGQAGDASAMLWASL